MGTVTLDYLRTRTGLLKSIETLVQKEELGEAAFRSPGPGEGDLMEVGFLGYGARGDFPYLDNLDTYLATGFYRFNASSEGRPFDGPGWVLNVSRASAAITQIASRQQGTGHVSSLYVRIRSVNGWSPWYQVLNNAQSFNGLNSSAVRLVADLDDPDEFSTTEFCRTDTSTAGRQDGVASFTHGIFIPGFSQSKVFIRASRRSGLLLVDSWDSDGTRNPTNVMWSTYNTIVDANGFIKEASPVIQLHHNKAVPNALVGEFQFETTGTGIYIIRGTLGFAKKGWYIETPRDANGNIQVFVEYEQDVDGTITVRTYEPDYDNGRTVAGAPKDIPEGRWIDIRLHEEPPPHDTEPEIDSSEEPGGEVDYDDEPGNVEELDD